MKELTVKITNTADIDWSAQDKAKIDHYMWDSDYMPETYAQVAYAATGDEKEGLYIHFFCREANPRAIYTEHYDPVYRDSCMEIFFTMKAPDAEPNGYINIESNSNPTTLICYGFDRYTRTRVVDMGQELFPVTAKKTDETWELFEFVPVKALKEIFKLEKIDESTVMGANFYKCGGDHEILPYGMWAPIDSPTPDFHRPEFFGKLVLVK